MTLRKTHALVAIMLAGYASIAVAARYAQTTELSSLPAIGEVDPRFLSYNVEMVEITGGRFWRPYGSAGNDRYEYRPPMDLSDVRLRAAAKALAPAYVRYSGTWANSTWFADSDNAPEKAPDGFEQTLTRQQWRGAVDFAKATGSEIVTSFATSPGTRDAKGVWQTVQAERFLAYTKQIGGRIAATEFANEPNMITLTKPPAGYTSADYRRDYITFATWLRKASPETLLLAPGYAELGEPTRAISRKNKTMQQFEADELLTADLPTPDAYSFHFYGGASERCGGKLMGLSAEKALSDAWLDAVDPAIARMAAERDKAAPDKPLWNTESGESACGGNPWASKFADTFRFVDTLGRSAQKGVKVFIHNTLAASDYALLDEHTYAPRPNFWAAALWKRTMGTTVLSSPKSQAPEVRIYAHCSPQERGSVGLAAINTGDATKRVKIGHSGLVWVLYAPSVDSETVTINGKQPKLGENGALTGFESVATSGNLDLPAHAIVFVAVKSAGNSACR